MSCKQGGEWLSDEALGPAFHIGLLLLTMPSIVLYLLRMRTHQASGSVDLFATMITIVNVFPLLLARLASVKVLAILSFFCGALDAYTMHRRRLHASKLI
jgi:hypothetical protein